MKLELEREKNKKKKNEKKKNKKKNEEEYKSRNKERRTRRRRTIRRTKKETNLLNLVVTYTRDLYIARVLDVGHAARFVGLLPNDLVKHTSPNGLYVELFSNKNNVKTKNK